MSLTGIPWRLIGIGVAALAVVLLLWRINSWRDGYLENDATKAQYAGYQVAVADREKDAIEEREAAGKRIEHLAISVENLRATIEELRAKPIESVVYREKPAKNGKCDDPRIGPEYVGVWNDTAEAASRAVHAPD